MSTYICNAFSLNMLSAPANLECIPADVAAVQEFLAQPDEAVSAVGHATTAAIFSAILDRDIPVNRCNLTLMPNDRVVVGQYSGPRLEEGATSLPEGARIVWWLVTIR